MEKWDGGLTVGRYGETLLFPAYQPIFKICEDGQITLDAFEGLVRPFLNGKLLDPGRFFESVHVSDRLFIECMCQALHIRNYYLADPCNRKLFVNVNPANFQSMEALQREFNFMVQQFPKYDIKLENVVFELLETAAYSQEILLWLRRLASDSGFLFAVDDFGQEHSDIQRYQTLRPDVVKIDRAYFLRCIGQKACYHLMMNLIHQFHVDGAIVVIEGIETAEQLQIAIDLGADFVQGYHLERPQILPHRFDEYFVRETREPISVNSIAG